MLRALLRRVMVALALAGAAQVAASHDGHRPATPSRAAPDDAFPLPQPGTYALPPIRQAGGGGVLDDDGRARELRDLLRGRVTVLAFVYTRCGDVCPTATFDMGRLQDLAAKDRALAGRLQLATMSFDPEHDRPEVMRAYAAQWRSPDPAAAEWLFLTAPDRPALASILTAYDQAVDRKAERASASGALNHIFRAFLIDREGRVRNIYSLDFFEPRLVLGDVRTLLLEEQAGAAAITRR